MEPLNQGVSETRREKFLAEHRRLSRWTPLVESDKQALKCIKHAVGYFLQIHEVKRPQIRQELFNYAFVFYKKRRKELNNAGEECREGLIMRMILTELKKFVECDRINSEYGISMSGSKALQTSIDQEIQMKLIEFANEDKMIPTWKKHELQRDSRMGILVAIDSLPSVDQFILHSLLEPVDKSEIILILESNDVKNARMLIRKAEIQLGMRLRSNN